MEDVEKKIGFVALIDILGFRELVSRDDDLASVRRYVGTVTSMLATSTGPNALQFVLFSDNLVVNTRDDSPESFELLVVACSNLVYELAGQSVSVRGAVSHGPFIRSPTTGQGVIVAGQPIVEADYYQHQQDWVGIILAPSVVRANPTLKTQSSIQGNAASEDFQAFATRNKLGLHLRHWEQIPFHKTSPLANHEYDGYVIVPLPRLSESRHEVGDSLGVYYAHLARMKECAPDPASQQKYSNTMIWLDGVRASWSLTAYR